MNVVRYIETRIAELTGSRDKMIAALRVLEQKREELGAHINAHNGAIAELQVVANNVGAENGEERREGADAQPEAANGQGGEIPRRLDEAVERPIGGQ